MDKKYNIEIINNIKNDKFLELKELIREFAINVFMVQKFNLYNYSNAKKTDIIKNYKTQLSKEEIKILEKDIIERIDFAKKAIENTDKDKITRYYILIQEENVIGFQTAQVRNNNGNIEGWRNFAYIKSEYAGKTGIVVDTYKNVKKGNLSNIIYENITQWFKESNVTKEKTATGRKMYKNILTYIVHKGFIIENEDTQRIYLTKDYSKQINKEELKKIYKEYVNKEKLL